MRSDDLQIALERLAQVRDLLLVSNPGLAKRLSLNVDEGVGLVGDAPSIERAVVEAPILSSPVFRYASDPKNVERLEQSKKRIYAAELRAGDIAERFDSLLDRYYTIVGLVNEKTVLLRDHLRDLEEEKEGGGYDDRR